MARFIALFNFTEQGIRNIKDTVHREHQFAQMSDHWKIKIHDVYWTWGQYDGVLIFDAPDDAAATAALLWLASQGNVRSHTLRAFGKAEITPILAKLG